MTVCGRIARFMDTHTDEKKNHQFFNINALSLCFQQPDQSAIVTWAQMMMMMMKPMMMNHLWSSGSSRLWPTASARSLSLLCFLGFTYSTYMYISRY